MAIFLYDKTLVIYGLLSIPSNQVEDKSLTIYQIKTIDLNDSGFKTYGSFLHSYNSRIFIVGDKYGNIFELLIDVNLLIML